MTQLMYTPYASEPELRAASKAVQSWRGRKEVVMRDRSWLTALCAMTKITREKSFFMPLGPTHNSVFDRYSQSPMNAVRLVSLPQLQIIPAQLSMMKIYSMLEQIGFAFCSVEFERIHGIKNIPLMQWFQAEVGALSRQYVASHY